MIGYGAMIGLEMPDERLQRCLRLGRRVVWQFRGELGAFERNKIEGAEFDSEERLISLPTQETRDPYRCWNGPSIAGKGRFACCWSCLLSGGSFFIEYNRQPYNPASGRHFDTWEAAEAWVWCT